jgi:pantoate--beta-alanine ligase
MLRDSPFPRISRDTVLKDLLTAFPTTDNLHIIPTTRDGMDNLALSSRNAYLTPSERPYAGTLYKALSLVKSSLGSSASDRTMTVEDVKAQARDLIESAASRATSEGITIKYDYIEVFDKTTFEPIRGELKGREGVVAGAIWLGKTRLIDNLLIGWDCLDVDEPRR